MWCPADDRARSNEIAGPDRDISFQNDMRLNDIVVAQNNFRTDDRVRSNFDIAAELRGRIDDGCRMDLQSTPASLKLK